MGKNVPRKCSWRFRRKKIHHEDEYGELFSDRKFPVTIPIKKDKNG
jgi:hypothetical protein